MSVSAVHTLFDDYTDLVKDLGQSPSGLTALNRSYHKHLIIAAASGLEDEVKKLVPDIFSRLGRQEFAAFVSKRVMARGYHQLFQWEDRSAKGFFTSFGDGSVAAFKNAMSADVAFKAQHDAFMKLGDLRNTVVHNDYASALVEITPDEVMEAFDLALVFVTRIESLITASE